jgi:hypothetical protein
MRIGTRVNVFVWQEGNPSPELVDQTIITESGLPSGRNNSLSAYKTANGDKFYMKPKPFSKVYQSVDSDKCWLVPD